MPETATLVLLKADKGLKELASSRPTLDIKSRQVLILADGERSLGEIQVLRPSLDVRELAGALVADGFLHDPTGLLPTARIAPVPDHVTPDAPPPIEPDRLTQIKALMIDSARQHLGLLGGEIIAEIARSRGAAGLVIDGAVRDAGALLASRLPAEAIARHPRSELLFLGWSLADIAVITVAAIAVVGAVIDKD